MTRTDDKTAFITGASAGFGAALARRFVARGIKVIVAARRLDRLEALSGELGVDKVLPVRLDVQERDAVARAIAALPAAFADVEWLINNAGLALGLEAAPRADPSDWQRMIDTNCKGLVCVTRALLPRMLLRGRGHVVNLGSVAGTYPYPGGNVYGATKAFVRQFSLNLRSDLHGTGIRVTCIEPGICGGTEFSEVRYRGDQKRAAAVYAGMKALAAEDVAEAILWAIALPAHVNINSIEMMPVSQSWAPFLVHRTP